MSDIVIVVVNSDEKALLVRLARLQDEERWLTSVLDTHDNVVRSLYREQGPVIATNHQRHVVNFTEEMRKRLLWVQEEIKRVSAVAKQRDSEENKPTSSLAQFLNSHKEARDMSSVSYTILHVEDLKVNIRPTTSGHALTMKGSTVGQAGGSEVTIHVPDSAHLEQVVFEIQRYLSQEKTHEYRKQYAESSRVGCVF